MLNSVMVSAFADEVEKIAFNDAHMARKGLGDLVSKLRRSGAKAPVKAPSKPPALPAKAVGKATSRKLTPGSQQAAARAAA